MTTINTFNFVTFSNNVTVINTTPHPVTMQDVNGNLVSVPTSVLINAKAIEKQVSPLQASPLFVKTEFVGTDEGRKIISSIKESFNQNTVAGETLVIIGSIIAAQAYPGEVFGLIPVPGYERVAPSEKRMRCDKFTTFA